MENTNQIISYTGQTETDEEIYLKQIIDIDGYDEVIKNEEVLYNSSGREIGIIYTIGADTQEFIDASIEIAKEDLYVDEEDKEPYENYVD